MQPLKNLFKEPGLESRLLWGVALIPVVILCFLAVSNRAQLAAMNAPGKEKVLTQEALRFSASMEGWRSLAWSEKEKLVYAAILIYREQMNCAILKSPGYYVVRLNRLSERDPAAMKQGLFTLLKGLAIMDYDFYSGVNADEQALKFLGPEMFRVNQKTRKADAERVVPTEGAF